MMETTKTNVNIPYSIHYRQVILGQFLNPTLHITEANVPPPPPSPPPHPPSQPPLSEQRNACSDIGDGSAFKVLILKGLFSMIHF